MNTEYRFNAAMDWWVAALVACALLAVAASIPITIWYGAVPFWATVLACLVLVTTFLLITDRAFYTTYSLSSEGLIVRGQLRRIVVPYRSMRSITRGTVTGLLSLAGQKRFSLSSDCLVITLDNEDWKRITVSPRQKDLFLTELLEKIDGERSRRASAKRVKRS